MVASCVRADSRVAIRIWKALPASASAIFSTAGSSMPVIAAASARMVRATRTRVGRGCAHGATGVSGGSPDSTATTLRAARSAIAVRVSLVALPRWGDSSTFSSASRSGSTAGSFS